MSEGDGESRLAECAFGRNPKARIVKTLELLRRIGRRMLRLNGRDWKFALSLVHV